MKIIIIANDGEGMTDKKEDGRMRMQGKEGRRDDCHNFCSAKDDVDIIHSIGSLTLNSSFLSQPMPPTKYFTLLFPN